MSELLEPSPDEWPTQPVPAVGVTPALGPAVEPAPTTAPDVQAFTTFYREEVGALTGFLLYLGASLADAADIAQETMIDAFRSWSSVRRPGAWTRTVASRKY